MNSSNYHSINSKDFLSNAFNPYLYTNSNNQINNNPISFYLSSSPNLFRQNEEMNQNNYVKKSINLDISPSIDNSVNQQKQENYKFVRPYSSFSNHKKNMNPNENIKKTLILDLDETLVHSAFTPFSRKSDLILNINIEGENRTLYVLKRPHVDKFLYELSLVYEIIIFTASISQYANPLLDELDKNKYIKYRLFREHCTYTNGIYIKDLKIFDRKVNNMIIIDNNPLSYDNNIENGIPILSWYDNINDNELLKLLPLLKYMSNPNVPDVRTVIAKIVNRDKNEVDYIVINKILNINSKSVSEKNYNSNKSNLTIENKYRKKNKSQEPRKKISNKNGFTKIDNNYNNNNLNQKEKPLKNNYMKKYNDENRNTLNIPKNNNNIYDNKTNNISEKINIDKMDPYGIRKSIFAPEEYNISYSKSLNYSYNINNNIGNNNKEKDILNREMKINNDYILNDYKNQNNTITNNKEYENRSLTPNIDNRRKNDLIINNEDYLSLRTIPKKYSLVELTKMALHLIDNDSSKENKEPNEYGTINSSKEIRTLYKYNNYFKKENDIIYNDYINNNNFNKFKSSKNLNKNSLNNKYFNNYIKDFNNINEKANNKKNNKLIISEKINYFNERFMNTDKLLNSNRTQLNNDNKKRLLDRMNNEKINNFLNNKKNNNNNLYQTENNFYNNFTSQNNYFKNFNHLNKDNYTNAFKNSVNKNKNDFNINRINFDNNKDNQNYPKKKNTFDKIYNNRDFLFDKPDNSNNSNIIENHSSFNYYNTKKLPLQNLKKSVKSNKEQYNLHQLTRSSSFINSNSEIDKLLDKYSLNKNENKENINNNINYDFNYAKNLNYKYDLINVQENMKFNNNNNYFNSFKSTNFF